MGTVLQSTCGQRSRTKTKELRDGLAEMGEEEVLLASSFHPLAAIKIAAATIAYEKGLDAKMKLLELLTCLDFVACCVLQI